jgi:4'-phosphopantetheinyl transferase EntD
VIEAILPPGFASAESTGDSPGTALWPAEEPFVARASAARRREFTTVRLCARAAIRELGIVPQAIPRGERGEPRWPPGVVGSMTHCTGYRAAAVARSGTALAVGIDAEPHAPLPPDVLGMIALPDELPMLSGLATSDPGRHWDRVLFSTKESVYKAWFPLTRCWLDFGSVAVTFDAPRSAFTARILLDGSAAGGGPAVIPGRFIVRDGLVITAAVLETADGARLFAC